MPNPIDLDIYITGMLGIVYGNDHVHLVMPHSHHHPHNPTLTVIEGSSPSGPVIDIANYRIAIGDRGVDPLVPAVPATILDLTTTFRDVGRPTRGRIPPGWIAHPPTEPVSCIVTLDAGRAQCGVRGHLFDVTGAPHPRRELSFGLWWQMRLDVVDELRLKAERLDQTPPTTDIILRPNGRSLRIRIAHEPPRPPVPPAPLHPDDPVPHLAPLYQMFRVTEHVPTYWAKQDLGPCRPFPDPAKPHIETDAFQCMPVSGQLEGAP